jgi:hypothetical protein
MVLGLIVAIGSLAATEARAQEDAAGSGATAPSAQQGDAAGNEPSENPQSKATTKSDPSDYGTYVDGPATVDADGVPVPKPNPMSDFRKRSRTFDNVPIEMPLLDDPRTDGSATDGQTK